MHCGGQSNFGLMKSLGRIPYGLVWFRLGLAPCFPLGYALEAAPWFFVVLLGAGIVSDIFDGVLARRWGTSSPRLRTWDSNVDTVFYGLAAITVVLLHAEFLAAWRGPLMVMFGLMIAQNVVNGVRFGRQPAYHMWSGKLWSIVLVVALIGLFLGRPSAWAVDVVVVLGIWNSVEGMVASLILATPMVDVPTVFHAVRIAAGERQRRS